MKAIVQTEAKARSIAVEDRPNPEIGPDEVLVGVHAAGVCGSDVGAYLYKDGYEWVPTPRIMGHEYAGVVETVGANVTCYEPGDRVVERPVRHCGRCYFCENGLPNVCESFEVTGMHHDGCWAEYVAVPQRHLHTVPDDVSLANAAIAEPASVAARTVLDNATVGPGDFVLVEGPGPIGLLSAEIAAVAGADVLVSGVSQDERYRLPLAEQLGFETVTVDAEDLSDRVVTETDGRGADVVVDATGHPSGIETGLDVVRRAGTVAVVGLPNANSDVFFTDAVRKEVTVQCSYASLPNNFDQALGMLGDGRIDADTLVDRRFSADEPAAALEAFVAGETCKPTFTFE